MAFKKITKRITLSGTGTADGQNISVGTRFCRLHRVSFAKVGTYADTTTLVTLKDRDAATVFTATIDISATAYDKHLSIDGVDQAGVATIAAATDIPCGGPFVDGPIEFEASGGTNNGVIDVSLFVEV